MLRHFIRISIKPKLITPKDKSLLRTKDYSYISVSRQWKDEKFDDHVALRGHNLWFDYANEISLGKAKEKYGNKSIWMYGRTVIKRIFANTYIYSYDVYIYICVHINIFESCKADVKKWETDDCTCGGKFQQKCYIFLHFIDSSKILHFIYIYVKLELFTI